MGGPGRRGRRREAPQSASEDEDRDIGPQRLTLSGPPMRPESWGDEADADTFLRKVQYERMHLCKATVVADDGGGARRRKTSSASRRDQADQDVTHRISDQAGASRLPLGEGLSGEKPTETIATSDGTGNLGGDDVPSGNTAGGADTVLHEHTDSDPGDEDSEAAESAWGTSESSCLFSSSLWQGFGTAAKFRPPEALQRTMIAEFTALRGDGPESQGNKRRKLDPKRLLADLALSDGHTGVEPPPSLLATEPGRKFLEAARCATPGSVVRSFEQALLYWERAIENELAPQYLFMILTVLETPLVDDVMALLQRLRRACVRRINMAEADDHKIVPVHSLHAVVTEVYHQR